MQWEIKVFSESFQSGSKRQKWSESLFKSEEMVNVFQIEIASDRIERSELISGADKLRASNVIRFSRNLFLMKKIAIQRRGSSKEMNIIGLSNYKMLREDRAPPR